jgi:hypothetical protein
MKIQTLIVALATLATLSGTAHAGEVFNQNLASPGVYFGSGNANGSFAVDTQDGVELGLRSKVSNSLSPITPIGDIYKIPLGNKFNFDYSINPFVGGSEVSLSGTTSLISITDIANHRTFNFDPSAIPDNAHNAGALGGYQNSEKISFSFLDPLYNANQNDTFKIVDTLMGPAFGKGLSVTNTVVVGAGAVPEPAAWAMMFVGFAAIGSTIRLRRNVVATA